MSIQVTFQFLQHTAYDLQEPTASIHFLHLFPNISHYFIFLLYHSPPAPSQSPSCTLSWGVPSQFLSLWQRNPSSLHMHFTSISTSDLHCQWFFFDYLHSYRFDKTSSQNILKICLMHLLINICRSLVLLFVTFQCFAPMQKKRLDIMSKNSQLHCNRHLPTFSYLIRFNKSCNLPSEFIFLHLPQPHQCWP